MLSGEVLGLSLSFIRTGVGFTHLNTGNSCPETGQGSLQVTAQHRTTVLRGQESKDVLNPSPKPSVLVCFYLAEGTNVPSQPVRASASSLAQSLTQHDVDSASFLLPYVQIQPFLYSHTARSNPNTNCLVACL